MQCVDRPTSSIAWTLLPHVTSSTITWRCPRPASVSAGYRVGVVLGPLLEGQDLRVLDDPVPDLDGPTDRVVRVPCLGSGHHRAQIGEQSFADLPSSRV